MKYPIHILIFAMLLASCAKTNKPNSESDFIVDAQVIGRTSGCSEDLDRLIMQIIVTNNSIHHKSFWIYKCSWEDSFIFDRNDVQFSGRECIGNFPIRIDLKPSENIVFINTINLLSDSLIYQPINLRIGLLSLEENELKAKLLKGIPDNKKTYWSKPIRIDYSHDGYKINP